VRGDSWGYAIIIGTYPQERTYGDVVVLHLE
jgi:hypothetical protein